jgi:hypothetical protein
LEENRIPKRVLYMNLEITRPRGRPRNRWQDEVRKDVKIILWRRVAGKIYKRVMEEAPENGKETTHSAHGSGMNGWL